MKSFAHGEEKLMLAADGTAMPRGATIPSPHRTCFPSDTAKQQRRHQMQFNSHARSFVGTTILATFSSIALIIVVGMTIYMPWWASGQHLLPEWEIWLLVGLVAVALLAVAGAAALVAIGGLVVILRDFCEERGVPYFPVQPRERIAGPMTLAIRRLLNPSAGLRPGEMVEVRSLPEILATLDERGCLDGLPFMPEMAAFCGHRVPVHRRLEKVWEYAHGTGMRRVHNAVLLQVLRCNGQSHGGCQAACQLIWKEAWLKRPGTDSSGTLGAPRPLDLGAHTHVTVEGGLRYICQMTEIQRASSRLEFRGLGHYWRDLKVGNLRLIPLIVAFSVRLFNWTHWRLGGAIWPVVKPPDSGSSPHQDLGLQPGQMVRVKSKHAIEATLNRNSRNRGLSFGEDMVSYCGGSYRVAARINRIVHEGTGELLLLKTPSILLEGVTAIGGSILNPQNEFYFWREIWLDPEPTHAEVSPDGHASPPPTANGEAGTSIALSSDASFTKT
jgi:hypothetical protein